MSDQQSPSDIAGRYAGGGQAFLVGYCPGCDRDVLTARQLGDGETLIDVCIHCDQRLDSDQLRWMVARQLAGLGYVVDGEDDGDCDSHGGCRDGSCGVRQPGD